MEHHQVERAYSSKLDYYINEVRLKMAEMVLKAACADDISVHFLEIIDYSYSAYTSDERQQISETQSLISSHMIFLEISK